MTEVFRDRLLGIVLMAVAIAWLAASRYTIPEGYSGSFFGPRAFPNALGFLLLLLSVILVAQTFSKKTVDDDEEEELECKPTFQQELWATLVTFGFLISYFVALPIFGFVLTTTLLIGIFLFFVLGKRSIPLIICMPLGFSIGLWLLMGKLLGVYLPTGMFSWSF